jgi:hypothetical protein
LIIRNGEKQDRIRRERKATFDLQASLTRRSDRRCTLVPALKGRAKFNRRYASKDLFCASVQYLPPRPMSHKLQFVDVLRPRPLPRQGETETRRHELPWSHPRVSQSPLSPSPFVPRVSASLFLRVRSVLSLRRVASVELSPAFQGRDQVPP